MKILTAYREGGQYRPEHIRRLESQVNAQGYELTPVHGEFPHWWCKLNLFQIEGPALYFDLDTTLVDDITPLVRLAEEKRFITLRDFNYPERVASGVMAWNGDMSHIYEIFAEDPDGYMKTYPGGDQDFIGDSGSYPEFWQDLLPNHVQSYKLHVKRNGIHPDCRVVAWHGKPKPWEMPELSKE